MEKVSSGYSPRMLRYAQIARALGIVCLVVGGVVVGSAIHATSATASRWAWAAGLVLFGVAVTLVSSVVIGRQLLRQRGL